MESLHYEDRYADPLALGLGWFSLALGVTEVVAPRAIARLSGLRPDDSTESLVRTFGFREIGNGIAILAQPDRAQWLWSRVAGDALDLSALGRALASSEERGRAAAATAAVVGVAVLDIIAAQRAGRRPDNPVAGRGVRVEQVVTINKPIEEVYAFWRNFENLPRFMQHLEEVRDHGNGRSSWQAKGPAGTSVRWDAELVQDIEHQWIAWQSLPGADVVNRGSVRFTRAPGARGTELRVQLEYEPPAGAIGRGIAWLFGEEPDQQIRDDLRRFKQLLETGVIPVSDGPALWRAAQPRGDRRSAATEVRR